MNAFGKLLTMFGAVGIFFIVFGVVVFIFNRINTLIPNLATTLVCGFITSLLLKNFIIKICDELGGNE